MTFTYTPATPTDTTRVRFHLDDTVEAAALFSDEEIAFAIAEGGSWQKATLTLIDRILQRLGRESGTKLDWLEVDRAEGIKMYQAQKVDKRREFGIRGTASATAGVVHMTREDRPDVEAD